MREIKFRGFGTFDVRTRAERKGLNPRTGEEIQLPAHKIAHFVAGRDLRYALKS